MHENDVEENSEICLLDDVPADVLSLILLKLSVPDRVNFAKACSASRSLSQSLLHADEFWSATYRQRFPNVAVDAPSVASWYHAYRRRVEAVLSFRTAPHCTALCRGNVALNTPRCLRIFSRSGPGKPPVVGVGTKDNDFAVFYANSDRWVPAGRLVGNTAKVSDCLLLRGPASSQPVAAPLFVTSSLDTTSRVYACPSFTADPSDSDEGEGAAMRGTNPGSLLLRPLRTLRGHAAPILCSTALGREAWATGSADKTIRIWSLASKGSVAVFRGHQAPVLALKLTSPPLLASCSADRLVKLWDLHRVTLSTTIKCPEAIMDLIPARDAPFSNPLLAVGQFSVFALDPRSPSTPVRLGGGAFGNPVVSGEAATSRTPHRLAVSAWGDLVAVGGRSGSDLQIFSWRKLEGPPVPVPVFPSYLGSTVSAVHVDRFKIVATLAPPGIPPPVDRTRRDRAVEGTPEALLAPLSLEEGIPRVMDSFGGASDGSSEEGRAQESSGSDGEAGGQSDVEESSEEEATAIGLPIHNSSCRVLDPRTFAVTGGILDEPHRRLELGVPSGGLAIDRSSGVAAILTADSSLVVATFEGGEFRGDDDHERRSAEGPTLDGQGTQFGGKFWT